MIKDGKTKTEIDNIETLPGLEAERSSTFLDGEEKKS